MAQYTLFGDKQRCIVRASHTCTGPFPHPRHLVSLQSIANHSNRSDLSLRIKHGYDMFGLWTSLSP